ncbi:MAG: STAS domain-containing protein [Gemmatimonadota bacterium]|nr:MAG: STAS domain-containing protein [Gemmatimonadota bacterium]
MITTKHLKDIVILEPQGVIMGGPETTEFRATLEELLSKDLRKIVVDLQEVKWINAAGIGVLVDVLTRLRNMSGDLKLARCCGRIGTIMQLLKMDNLFSHYETLETAIASFA